MDVCYVGTNLIHFPPEKYFWNILLYALRAKYRIKRNNMLISRYAACGCYARLLGFGRSRSLSLAALKSVASHVNIFNALQQINYSFTQTPVYTRSDGRSAATVGSQ